jgi:hypothetical protein
MGLAMSKPVNSAAKALASAAPTSTVVTPGANAAKAPADIPHLHHGGPVPTDGIYKLKAGEHVLTAKEAAKAKKHALLASGLKSLAMPGKGSQEND